MVVLNVTNEYKNKNIKNNIFIYETLCICEELLSCSLRRKLEMITKNQFTKLSQTIKISLCSSIIQYLRNNLSNLLKA